MMTTYQRRTQFLSTPSARRATPLLLRNCRCARHFYPRPPRGGRLYRNATNASRNAISIHALREEGDASRNAEHHAESNFYPRPPRGGRRRGQQARGVTKVFLSTPSARRATASDCGHADQVLISIHALREEGDAPASSLPSTPSNFYPRPPRGGRPTTPPSLRTEVNFYPRPPRGGRPRATARAGSHSSISIHALREEGDA